MTAKKILALLLALVLALSLAACSVPGENTGGSNGGGNTTGTTGGGNTGNPDDAGGSTPTASGEKVFRYSANTEPTTLDQQKGNSIGDNELIHVMQEGLVRNVGGEIQAAGAESWEISDDGLTYTFHLRDNTWSDGQPVTAGDYVYGLQRLMDPATASPYAFIGEIIKNGLAVETGEKAPGELGVSAPDDSTFVIELENPTAYFLALIGSCAQYTPCRQDLVEQYAETFAADAGKNAYSGPFKLVSSANQIYVFEPNENFWNRENVNFDRVEVSIVTNTDTALAMYEAGDLDYVKIPTAQVPNYAGRDNSYMNGNEDYLYINHQSENKVLGNKNFRLALNYGLNREVYNKLANNDVYDPWNRIVMPLVNGVNGSYGDEYELDAYPMAGDMAKAQEYLQAAMDELGIANASDITIEFVTTDAESNKKIAEVIQEQWQTNLGINVTIRQVTYSEIYGTVFPTHDFEVGYGGWGPDYPDPYTYLELFIGGHVYNYSNYANDEVDALLKGSQTETDVKVRMDMLNKAEQLLLDDGANVPLQLRTDHYLLDDDITGVVFYFSAINIDWAYGDVIQ